jgi:hypothetical protein
VIERYFVVVGLHVHRPTIVLVLVSSTDKIPITPNVKFRANFVGADDILS